MILRMMMVLKMLGTNNPPPSLTSQYHKSSRTKKFILMKNKIRQSYTTLHYQGVALHYTLVRTITTNSLFPPHTSSLSSHTHAIHTSLYKLNTIYTLHIVHYPLFLSPLVLFLSRNLGGGSCHCCYCYPK